MMKKRYTLYAAGFLALCLMLFLCENLLDPYMKRILNLCAIYIVCALSLNLIYGFTGQFSLGHAGFMGVGAYTSALLTLSSQQKEASFIIKPLIYPLNSIQLPFFLSIIIAGLIAAIFGVIIGIPSLRLKGDYLAITTLAFAEIFRIVINNTISITNGPLGLKGIPEYTNLYWSWGSAFVTLWVIYRLIKSSYGRAFMAIREDEVAADTMGINPFRHKMLAFIIGSFFAGIGGALLGHLITTIDPKTFIFILTFNILIIVVIGGKTSFIGTCIASISITILLELLRPIEGPMNFFGLNFNGLPGLRMVIFSCILIFVIIFYGEGIGSIFKKLKMRR